MTDKYLLNVSIGPVQEFIADARKVRDLWAGSYLLSCVTFEALKPFLDDPEVTLIYPDVRNSDFYKTHKKYSSGNPSQTASLPNHFLAAVPEGKLDDVIARSRKQVEKFWFAISNDVRNRLKKDLDALDRTWDMLWESQICDVWEFVWVATKITANDLINNYGKKAREARLLLEQRKATRAFCQWQGSRAVKCTQCGKRETMGPEDLGKNRKFWEAASQKLKHDLKPSERLCGVCLLKRFIPLNMRFDSTADVAVIPFRRLLATMGSHFKESFFESYSGLTSEIGCKKASGFGDIEGAYLYRHELNPRNLVIELLPHLRKNTHSLRTKENAVRKYTDDIKASLEEIEKWAIKEHGTKLTPYYVILAMDGDNVGEWLSNAATSEDQMGSSRKLGECGAAFIEVINNYWGGACIYSGGDDLLAFGPLEKAFSTACRLRNESITRTASEDSQGLTMSAGIVLTHYGNPLRKALEEARKNVEKAKDDFGRDSFVMTLQLSSRSSITAGYKWRSSDSGIAITPLDIFSRLIECMNRTDGSKLSSRFIYDLLTEMPSFYATNNSHLFLDTDMLEAEAKRLFKRHCNRDIAGFNDLLHALTLLANPRHLRKATLNYEENTMNLLRILSFLEREGIRAI